MSRQFEQRLLGDYIEPITVKGPILETALSQSLIESLVDSSHATVGISPAYNTTGRLVVLAIANATSVLVIQFQNVPQDHHVRVLLRDLLLCRTGVKVYSFDIAPLALALYKDHGLHVDNAIDIQSACRTKTRDPYLSIKYALSDKFEIFESNIRAIFNPESFTWNPKNVLFDLGQRAWIAHYLSQIKDMEHEFQAVAEVHTSKMPRDDLILLANKAYEILRLEQMKSNNYVHHHPSASGNNRGQIMVQQTRFANRIRGSPRQLYKVTVRGERGEYTIPVEIKKVNGKRLKLAVGGDMDGKKIVALTQMGQDESTAAQAEISHLFLRALQGQDSILQNPWMQHILGHGAASWPEDFFSSEEDSSSVSSIDCLSNTPLNKSQTIAIDCMLSHTKDKCVTIIQGPPGTGKTSVIAAFVQAALQSGQQGIWLTAQSNVAVKNIAEKLGSVGFGDWRLLVSKDFHFDWHEHLYLKKSLAQNVIRSDAFSAKTTKEVLGNAKVILCTLSMLSSQRMLSAKFTSYIPVNTLVVDEASQIQIQDYFPVFAKLKTIHKVCFIGDDKQLPPHGAGQITELQSIFEKSHLRENALFLDIQYRMPPQIGRFISDAVYDGLLQSNPNHPVTDASIACHFVNVSEGHEEHLDNQDTSWMNAAEVEVVVKIARQFETEERKYRIITPYESQRNAIEEKLKLNDLNWEDKCFNVDSFQGNEDDYIIISIVRSRELGFLQDLRRTNVMLTRCKKGMIICSSRFFLTKVAAQSLVGQLAEKVKEEAWVEVKDVENFAF